MDTGKAVQITDGMSDARYPVFDKNGKYIYFTASTDYALNTGWLDMSSIGRPSTCSVYLIVLKKDVPSPLAPESDEEKEEAVKPEKKEGTPATSAAGEEKAGEKKEGAVIDERFNGGGSVADYIIDYMRRPLLSYWHTREGADFTTPFAAIFGAKAMIINAFAGSGGDALPWMFRKTGIGPLVGKRTWCGLVGIYDYPPLIDGGFVTAPRLAFWNPDGTWDVENAGVTPDMEVE